MNYEVSLVLGAIASVVLTILLYRKVMPRRLDGNFNKPIFQFLHDYFHFKKLYLEEVLKFAFVLATVGCVVCGLFLLIGYDETYHSYYFSSGGYWSKESTFAYGLALLLGGPISLRLAYEGIMMFILLVKNVMEINNKLQAPAAQSEIPPCPEAEAIAE